jgi:hypothetical protein
MNQELRKSNIEEAYSVFHSAFFLTLNARLLALKLYSKFLIRFINNNPVFAKIKLNG